MISTAQLAQIKPTAVLINTARGGVIDEAALLLALHTKHIYGAGIDAFANGFAYLSLDEALRR